MKTVIIVEDLIKRYGDLAAVDGVSFEVYENEIFGIVGPNGAGKTTMVECLEGLRIPSEGSIRVLGTGPKGGWLQTEAIDRPTAPRGPIP